MRALRFFRGWRVVIGAGVGIGFGSAVFISVAFPLLAAAIAKAYGWSQTDVAKGASLMLLLQAIGSLGAGASIDRWGSRKVASVSVALFALSLAALAAAGGSYGSYLGACAAIGLLAGGTNMVGYARAISNWFDARRGLAMGAASGFQALGAISLPIVTQKIIAAANWSMATFAIAAFQALVCLPIVLWLIEDDPAKRGLQREAPPAPRASVGPPAQKLAAPGLTFAKLAASFVIMGFTFYAVVANIAFILTDAGLGAAEIGRLQAISGLSVLFGRVGFGRALDRWPAPRVCLVALAASAAFCFGLAHAQTPLIVAAAALGGISIGGESDLLPFMASRYWGREKMSRILGFFLFAFVIGAALGPVALAKASAAFGGPHVALYALVVLQLVPAALFLTLPPYPREPG